MRMRTEKSTQKMSEFDGFNFFVIYFNYRLLVINYKVGIYRNSLRILDF